MGKDQENQGHEIREEALETEKENPMRHFHYEDHCSQYKLSNKYVKEKNHEIQHEGPGGRQVSRGKG